MVAAITTTIMSVKINEIVATILDQKENLGPNFNEKKNN